MYLLSLFNLMLDIFVSLEESDNGKFRLMKVRDWAPYRIQHFFQLFMVCSKLGQIRGIKYY